MVAPDRGGHRQDALGDADGDAGAAAAAMAFEVKLALEGVVDRLDQLPGAPGTGRRESSRPRTAAAVAWLTMIVTLDEPL